MKILYYISFFSLFMFSFNTLKYEDSADRIKNQIWMKKNLDVSKYRNGENIPQAFNKEQWYEYQQKEIGAWCYYDFDSSNIGYGKLYNWYAVNDVRGIAPKGWRVATLDDWKELVYNIDLNGEEASALKTKDNWLGGVNSSLNTNSTGFSALPSGYIPSCAENKQQIVDEYWEDGKKQREVYEVTSLICKSEQKGWFGLWWTSTHADSTSKFNKNRQEEVINSQSGFDFGDDEEDFSHLLGDEFRETDFQGKQEATIEYIPDENAVNMRKKSANAIELSFNHATVNFNTYHQSNGLSVRCIKED